jgi:SAM-dependent methyltransferase
MFPVSGHRHGTRWYMPYRIQETTRAIQSGLDMRALPAGYGRWLDERIVEYPWLFAHLPDGPGKLLDAGSALNFDYMLREPKLRQKQLTIMTLAPEDECFWKLGVSYVFGDLRNLCFREGHFDYIVSISTVEHIGLDNTLLYTQDPEKRETNTGSYRAALQELRRVLRPGGKLYLTVPFGRHDVRKWLQVFDAQMVEEMVAAFRPASHSIDYFLYDSRTGWELSSAQRASNARYFDFRQDQPWEGHPVAAEAIAAMELVK